MPEVAWVILLAVFAGLALPVTAGQILWVNTVTTVTLALALAFEPAEAGSIMLWDASSGLFRAQAAFGYDLTLLRDMIQIRPRTTVVMSYGNPYLAEGLPPATAFVVGYGEGGFYGNQVAYADAFDCSLGFSSGRGSSAATSSARRASS